MALRLHMLYILHHNIMTYRGWLVGFISSHIKLLLDTTGSGREANGDRGQKRSGIMGWNSYSEKSVNKYLNNIFSLCRLQEKFQANNIKENQTASSDNTNTSSSKDSQKKPQNNCQSETKCKDRKVLSRLPPGATAAGVFPSPPPPGVLVIRTPRGPDGTKGFSGR